MASLKNGFCCICGEYGPLSFEHVPPASAYNKEKYTEHLLLDRLEKKRIKGNNQTRRNWFLYFVYEM